MKQSPIKLLIDEDTHLALAKALRARGFDSIHIREANRRGLADSDQLEFAIKERRCMLTFNVGEFVVLHGNSVLSGKEHYGIIVSAQKPIGRLLREMLSFLQTRSAEDVQSQLFFL